MKLVKTEITPLINNMIHLETREQPFFSSPFHNKPSFHSHPELQLTFIVEGYGKRVIGNIIEPFEPGDMVFIGSDVPHIWISDRAFCKQASSIRCKLIIAYFNPKIFLHVFSELKEFDDIREMIRQSSKGIKIFGETKNIIAEKLLELASKEGFEKVEGLLQIMNMISLSSEKSFILKNAVSYPEDLYPDKLVKAVNFMKENFHKPVTLCEVAAIVGMTEQSFCRFFKQRTRKNFTVFLNDLRLIRACEMLVQADHSIVDVSHLCGYSSSTHFCRKFKQQMGLSPLRYKNKVSNRQVAATK